MTKPTKTTTVDGQEKDPNRFTDWKPKNVTVKKPPRRQDLK